MIAANVAIPGVMSCAPAGGPPALGRIHCNPPFSADRCCGYVLDENSMAPGHITFRRTGAVDLGQRRFRRRGARAVLALVRKDRTLTCIKASAAGKAHCALARRERIGARELAVPGHYASIGRLAENQMFIPPLRYCKACMQYVELESPCPGEIVQFQPVCEPGRRAALNATAHEVEPQRLVLRVYAFDMISVPAPGTSHRAAASRHPAIRLP